HGGKCRRLFSPQGTRGWTLSICPPLLAPIQRFHFLAPVFCIKRTGNGTRY
ncbi:hypothetical protein BaRGS_00031516, partial [Batillaria attramentaria]